MNLNQTQFYLLVYLALVLISGTGEYVHLLPPGTFGNILLAVFGHAAGVFSPPPYPGNSSGSTKPLKEDSP